MKKTSKVKVARNQIFFTPRRFQLIWYGLVWFGLVGVVITNKKGTNSKNALGLKLFRNEFQLNIIYMVWFGISHKNSHISEMLNSMKKTPRAKVAQNQTIPNQTMFIVYYV